ncbi:MAG: hypothetical protein HUJ29_05205 [Gammaproteobacteria bacterium]|nr:hypothetical protein [Gammaproteobacteria bacterium]
MDRVLKWIGSVFTALMILTFARVTQASSLAGFDAYGLASGVGNIYYQLPLSRDEALRISIYNVNQSIAYYGFYKLYYPITRDGMTPYAEGGVGYAADGVAVAANVGIEIPVSIVIVDPYIGLVTGNGGTGYGIGLNIGLPF